MTIERVTVIGAGAMGSGIAQVLASAGLAVTLYDVGAEPLARGRAGIEKSLGRLVKKGSLSAADAAAIAARVRAELDLAAACRDAQLAIESVPELPELKAKVFAQLDERCPPDCILASNTSQINISLLAGQTRRGALVAGMHWFNPPPLMKLVELIRTPDTADQTLADLRQVCGRCGKEVVVVRDGTGFVTSRAFAANLLEGIRMYEEGLASKEDIDTAVKLALAYPMGPLELADYVGLDVVYHASKGMVEAFGDRFRPPQTLVNLVLAGHLGMKTGRGFYRWQDGKKIG